MHELHNVHEVIVMFFLHISECKHSGRCSNVAVTSSVEKCPSLARDACSGSQFVS